MEAGHGPGAGGAGGAVWPHEAFGGRAEGRQLVAHAHSAREGWGETKCVRFKVYSLQSGTPVSSFCPKFSSFNPLCLFRLSLASLAFCPLFFLFSHEQKVPRVNTPPPPVNRRTGSTRSGSRSPGFPQPASSRTASHSRLSARSRRSCDCSRKVSVRWCTSAMYIAMYWTMYGQQSG